jgi:hypothetical protein
MNILPQGSFPNGETGKGVILNRLSRLKKGETAEDVLEKARVLLLSEMLPRIKPGAVLHEDYEYLADIASRKIVHKAGGILHHAMQMIHAGQARWIAVTEIARLTGDAVAAAQLCELCLRKGVRIYTYERVDRPYEIWETESWTDFTIRLWMAQSEIKNYAGRVKRAHKSYYPIDFKTGENILDGKNGKGRHPNAQVPRGYVWDYPEVEVMMPGETEPRRMLESEKRIMPDLRTPRPDYIPPGMTEPPAYTMWDMIKRLFELSWQYGCGEVKKILDREMGFAPSPQHITRTIRNPFYAGRPTTRVKYDGDQKSNKEQPLSTIGTYETILTYAQWQALQEIIDGRRNGDVKTGSAAWASRLLECACGQPYISVGTKQYVCKGVRREVLRQIEERQKAELGQLYRASTGYRPLTDWKRTETCCYIKAQWVHDHLKEAIRAAFQTPDLDERLERFYEAQLSRQTDTAAIRRQMEQEESNLRAAGQRRERIIDMGENGQIPGADVARRLKAIDDEVKVAKARLRRLGQEMEQSKVDLAELATLRRYVTEDFDEVWARVSPQEKGIIARGFIKRVRLTGDMENKYFHEAEYVDWLGIRAEGDSRLVRLPIGKERIVNRYEMTPAGRSARCAMSGRYGSRIRASSPRR